MRQETIATHYGYNQKEGHGTMAVPIYQTTAYDFGNEETAANRFALKELGPIYTRLNNPTVDVFEARLAALEGGKAAIATSSGQAAAFCAIVNLAGNGDNIIVGEKVYGGTTSLTRHTLKRFGITTKIFNSDDASDLEGLIDENTKAIFFETLSNPQIAIADVEAITKIANKYGIVTIADNTVATPILYQPFKDGVDVITHSASKYISGQGLSIAGAVVANVNLNEKLKDNPRYPHFNEPDESYHGLVYSSLPLDFFDIFTLRIRLTLIRDIGASISPFNAFQIIQGLETLSLRIKEHSKNALAVAEFLESHPSVKSVNYPGLKSSPLHEKAKIKFKNGMSSGLISFEVNDLKTAKQVLNRVKIFSIVVNIGDSKSIITHPASTTHQQLSETELKSANVTNELIRLSVGLENSDDLIEDLKQALS